jgi:hypothetical protein
VPHKPFVRTLRAQWLGQQLRALREQRGMTLKLVSEHLHRDMSALARYERAEWPIRRGDVVALLDLYGFHNAAERARLLALAEEVWRTDRTPSGDTSSSGWSASRSCSESGRPGSHPSSTSWCSAGWSAGPRSCDRNSATCSTWPGGRPSTCACFRRRSPCTPAYIVFTMPQPYPAVAYIENLGGRLYLEASKSDKFLRAYDSLRKAALDPRESARLIAAIAEDLS